MEADFPAAHSMDTRFFAVDRDGRVGSFSTGEDGAVPYDAFAGDEAYELAQRLADLLPRCESVHVRAGQCVPGTPEPEQHREESRSRTVRNCILFLDALEPLQTEIAAGQAVPVPASEGVAVLLNGLPGKTFRGLHQRGLCRGCFGYYGPDEGESTNVSACGLYEYDHLSDGPCANPYGQLSRPERPIHVDQLPPDIRRLVGQMRFDSLSFAETPIVQPVEHASCEAWGGAYLDSAGKVIRPIPESEHLFDESLGDEEYRVELRQRYRIEEPTDEEDETE